MDVRSFLCNVGCGVVGVGWKDTVALIDRHTAMEVFLWRVFDAGLFGIHELKYVRLVVSGRGDCVRTYLVRSGDEFVVLRQTCRGQ